VSVIVTHHIHWWILRSSFHASQSIYIYSLMMNMEDNCSLWCVITVLKRCVVVQTHQPDSGMSFGNYAPSLSVPGRRPSSRHNTGTATLPDPLGIFSSAPSPKKESYHPPSSIHKIADKPGITNTKAPSAVTVSTTVTACSYMVQVPIKADLSYLV
jgi:hypothetical protein